MASTARKPAPNRTSTSDLNSAASPSSRLPARSSTPTTTNSTTRTRSVRSSTPVSARAAAHVRRESTLANDSAKEEAERAKSRANMEEMQDRLDSAESRAEDAKKLTDVLQKRLDEALAEQAKLEERTHECEEQAEALQNEKREAAQKIQKMEDAYESTRLAMEKEKEEWDKRQGEMQEVIQRLKGSLAQRNQNGEDEGRPGRQSMNRSPNPDTGNFAPPAPLQRSDSRNNSKLLLQKDELIKELRLQLVEAQNSLNKEENPLRQQAQAELEQLREANGRLMKENNDLTQDNQNYMLLLTERVHKGEFNPLSHLSMNDDALAALEGRPSGAGDEAGSEHGGGDGRTTLADELSKVDDAEKEDKTDDKVRKLVRMVQDLRTVNATMSAYIDKFVSRAMQHPDLMDMLDTSRNHTLDKELPPRPLSALSGISGISGHSAESAETNKSWYRRLTTQFGGTPGTAPNGTPLKALPRPMTTYIPRASTNTDISDPSRAPSIPISMKRASYAQPRGMRTRPSSERSVPAVTDFEALIGSAQAARARSDTPSQQGAAGNFPGNARDSAGSSMSDDGAEHDNEHDHDNDNASWRSSGGHSSRASDERTKMRGNQPRLLRLVEQQSGKGSGTAGTGANNAAAATAGAAAGTNAANKRATWFPGWMGGKKEENGTGAAAGQAAAHS